MRGLISYSSSTGNTEALARVIYDELSKDHDMVLCRVEDAKKQRVEDFDFVLHGIWVRMTDLDLKSKKFLKRLPQGTRLGIFGTSGGEHATDRSERLDKHLEEAEEGFDVIGTKLTFGKVNEAVIQRMDGIIGNLLPKHVKEWVKEMAIHSREATDEERLEVADYFRERLRQA